MSEKLITCERCGAKNLTPRGLKAHLGSAHCRRVSAARAAARESLPRQAAKKSRPASASKAPAPGQVSKGTKAITLADLEVLPPVRRVGRAQPVSIDVLETQIRDLLSADFSREQAFRNEAIYDRVAIGLCLLKGRELHLQQGQRPTSGNVSTSAKAEAKAEVGFIAWIEEKFPNFSTRTARNYMNGARNCGLTSDHGLEDIEALKGAQALHDKTAKELYTLKDQLKTKEEDNSPPPNLVAEVTRDLFSYLDQALQLRNDMDAETFEAVTTRLHATLEAHTGAKWIMADGDDSAQHGQLNEAAVRASLKRMKQNPSWKPRKITPAQRAKIAEEARKRWSKARKGAKRK